MFAAMSIRLRFCAGMAFAVGCHNALYACAGPKEREEDNAEPAAVEMLRVLADGYLANREHFRIVACRITVTQGRSKTIADAIAGAIGESVKHEIVWIVDGKDVVFRELHLDEAAYNGRLEASVAGAKKPQAGGPYSITVPYHTSELLTNGVDAVRYAHFLQAATLFPNGYRAPGIVNNPFDVGLMGDNELLNPAYMLREASDGKLRAWVFPDQKDQDQFVIRLDQKEGPLFKYWINLARGFLTSRIEVYTSP